MSTAFVAARPRRHPVGFCIVVALHAGAVLLLHNALGLRLPVFSDPAPIQARVLPDAAPAPDDPVQTVRDPRAGDVPIDQVAPPQDLTFDHEPDTTTVPWSEPVGPRDIAIADPAPTPLWTGAAVDPRWPLTRAQYPSASIRFGEEGSVLLELVVAPDGRVLAASVVESSGHERLDRAAVAEARRAWRLRPATLDGVPVESRHRIRVRFRLDQR
jgi:periplasmic protein TonB